jgi:hypothetical protein
LCVLVRFTSPLWTRAVAESLICGAARGVNRVDAVLIDDLDLDYLPFERARILRKAGVSSRVLVPVVVGPDGSAAPVSARFIEVLAQMARVGDVEMVPIVPDEPISLSAALHVRQFLIDKGIRSVAIVAPVFRSERSMLIYRAVLEPVGIAAYCTPVSGTRTPETWARSWHGVQDVALQFMKLQYYRFYVLPFRSGESVGRRPVVAANGVRE